MSDIVVGLQYGDEGKGKIVNYLAENNQYDYCIRYNGGPNAGHTIYKDNIKYVTHQVPTGIIYNIPCIIGDNCFIDIDKLKNELHELSEKNIHFNKIFISKNAHVITNKHLKEDDNDNKIGTTKSGIGPCAKSKYSRTGKRIQDLVNENYYFGNNIEIVDIYQLIGGYTKFYRLYHNITKYPKILVEGAQGYGLDINHGDYPYVTSSHCISSDVFNIGIPFLRQNNITIYGVAKCYETYVGNKEFQNPEDESLNLIQVEGNEIGATTGRTRQVNYLNMDLLLKSIWINQINKIIINKCDILKKINVYKFYLKDEINIYNNFNDFKTNIVNIIMSEIPWIVNKNDIVWSENAKSI